MNNPSSFKTEIKQLTEDYNFPNACHFEIYMNLLESAIGELESPTVLDIGCGSGIFRRHEFQDRLRPLIGTYWGLEPDLGIEFSGRPFDRVYPTMMENAFEIPDESINVAYSAMVLEHVDQPLKFLEAVKRVLKPGGMFIYCTPNSNSYFGIFCRVSRFFNADEFRRRKVKNKDAVDEYHYPIRYRMNSQKQLNSLGTKTGLISTVGFTESAAACRNYFPLALSPLFKLLKLKRNLIRNPKCLIHLIGMFEKPQQT